MNVPVRQRRIRDHVIGFFALSQVHTLFQRTYPWELGRLALALFGGLRPELIARLEPSDIDAAGRRITIRWQISKSRTTHELRGQYLGKSGYIMPGLPAVLWEWLEQYPFVAGPWDPFQRRCKGALDGFWIANGTRHTAAVYFAKMHGNDAARALLVHEGPCLPERHFIGHPTIKDAEEFYSLGPDKFTIRRAGTATRELRRLRRSARRSS